MVKKSEEPRDLSNDPDEGVLPPQVNEQEMITIPKQQFEDTLKRLSVVEGVIGKNGLQSFRDRTKDNTVKSAYLKVIKGKVVIGWELIENEVIQNSAGGWEEHQTSRITYQDKTQEDMPYVYFARQSGQKMYIIRKIRSQEEFGKDVAYYTLEDENANQFEISEKFLNP